MAETKPKNEGYPVFGPRYLPWLGSAVLAPLSVAAALAGMGWGFWWLAAIAGVLAVVGTIDFFQRSHTVSRNYPLLAHFRYFLESIGPEIRQYFIESDTDAMPFSRAQRAIVYQRAKSVLDKRPYGTQVDVYQPQYEWINHSMVPSKIDSHDFRIEIGGPRCSAPYRCSVFNISAMSFGSLSAPAVEALNLGARRGAFFHDTGEGGISKYHDAHGGDLVWEIGSGYFGCRDEEGRFDIERFRKNAARATVKMIEIKLSQGAKPGHGGILPAVKVTPEIAAARDIRVGVECESPAAHSEFDSPLGLLAFIARLREAAEGKPVGFKLAVGHPWEWFGIVKAMLECEDWPDFIVVDGGEGGTGAAPIEFTNHVGAPLTEALMLVHNSLVGAGLREHIRIGAAGKIISAFDLARTMAIGADWCNSARGFMFALGCIMAQSCHNDLCPTGVTTHQKLRQRGLVVPDKAERVFHYHENTLRALREMLQAAGLDHPCELGPEHIIRRVSASEVRSLAVLHRFIEPGELLTDRKFDDHPAFAAFWADARADSFAAPKRIAELARDKSR